MGIHSKLFVTVSPKTKKSVERNSSKINTSVTNIGETMVSGESLSYVSIDKTNTGDENINYFKSLSLPIKRADINVFTGTTSQNGGWSDSSFNSLGNQKVLMGVIDNDGYGEIIDGKSFKISLPIYTGYTTGGTPTGITTYNIYSTFPKTTIPKTELDGHYVDRSSYPQSLFTRRVNVAYLQDMTHSNHLV